MAWMIKNLENKDEYWNSNTGWGGSVGATVYGNLDKRSLLNLPVGGAWCKPPRDAKAKVLGDVQTFYLAVENFIGAHSGDDRASKELENLCEKLRTKDPLFCEMLAGYANSRRVVFQDMLLFAYKLLQLQS